MPSRNVAKVYLPDTFYHVYNRGWNLTKIFRDEEDYNHFEALLARHISPEPVKDRKGREYPHYHDEIQLNAYCLMENHFHLLVYQRDETALTDLMRSVLVAYTMYHNKKYRQRGKVFESTYKAVPIHSDEKLMHITRYIHLNRSEYRTWKHGSYCSKDTPWNE